MCVKCDGTGRLYTKVAIGACLVTACDCEHAEQARQKFEQEMADFRQRLYEAKERLNREVC
ncbi:hypothetical protein [Anoxybacteroides rupiense]|uniref:hypothetical protein n=1 Tax=Anoxybacteroides rupiense TaxID=311460 RepID=UPI001F0A0184|nr:hypothetical protein [Anoxybacillus rupiensis]